MLEAVTLPTEYYFLYHLFKQVRERKTEEEHNAEISI